ncbi:MAG: ankyrin repeat domain-containing protein [Candidatus Dadabacteria bacterium]|nr:ankyrin repeat domain-containing protein [Candidatus Dadabacteria bacterium]
MDKAIDYLKRYMPPWAVIAFALVVVGPKVWVSQQQTKPTTATDLRNWANAARYEDGETAHSRLLRTMRRVNATRDENGEVTLMVAAYGGQTEAIRELLKAGADVNARDNDGYTALMEAALFGQTEAIRELLEAGADKRARNNDGYTAFDVWQEDRKDHPDFQGISDLLRPER